MIKKLTRFEGSAQVERGDSYATEAVCLETGVDSAKAGSRANVPKKQPELAREAAAITGPGYA